MNGFWAADIIDLIPNVTGKFLDMYCIEYSNYYQLKY